MVTLSDITYEDMPVEVKLPTMVSGQDFEWDIQMLEDSDDETPRDTTGWDMTIKARSMDTSGEVVLTLTVGSGITHTAATGTFAVKISDTLSSAINVPYIVWDCKVTDADGDITYPFFGTIKVQQPVTR